MRKSLETGRLEHPIEQWVKRQEEGNDDSLRSGDPEEEATSDTSKDPQSDRGEGDGEVQAQDQLHQHSDTE